MYLFIYINEGWNQRKARTTEPTYLKFSVNVLITMYEHKIDRHFEIYDANFCL